MKVSEPVKNVMANKVFIAYSKMKFDLNKMTVRNDY